MKDLLALHYHNKLGHMSSTLTAYPIIREIYDKKGKDDVFILSQGHAALALYCVLGKGQELFDKYGVHPHRDIEEGLYCTTGSLGMGITVALGAAMSGRVVHCLISDGEAAEGCVWEALTHAPKYPNLKVHVNCNGMTALGDAPHGLMYRLKAFHPDIILHQTRVDLSFKWANTVECHYHVLTEEEYAQVIR